ncbi:YafY family transcriptional regulator [Brevibacillus ruminantium]|uniref:YafY family transcriptional regulator n=1 Tax=Brevibacillus ruminantium TaxID=2950604 RepID=A0ABY4WNV7_9BACL|nr:YafY family protein [Brevibacillus ruminantium]USG68354.1 YafY family transcriptional regulator [Brevibacillus ruminantium]
MRADRLLSLLLLLQNHGQMTSRELAELLEVSERTIHRDMEALSAAGIPVFAERGSHGGWKLAEGYRTTLTGLSTKEIQSLLLIRPTELLHDLGLKDRFEAAFQKLLAATPPTARDDAESVRQLIHIDGAGWHQSDEAFPFLPVVQEAVWARQKLLIRYQREEGVVERIVQPLGLVAKRNVWYMVAEVNGEYRNYRISRLQSAQLLEEKFERPEAFDLGRYWEQSTSAFKASLPVYPARLLLTETGLSRIRQERFAKIIQAHPAENDRFDTDVQFQILDSACEIVLGLGAHVEVLEPLELRQRVIAEAIAIFSLYEKK